MAIRNIVKDGDQTLRKKCRPVTEFGRKMGKILDDMADTMYRANGVGLAAPQIGFLRRFVICEMSDEEIVEIINPEVLEIGTETEVMQEGCLSVPGKSCYVKRPTMIKLKFQNRDGIEVIRTFEGFDARVCCHEIDHLDGILFYDKAVPAPEGDE